MKLRLLPLLLLLVCLGAPAAAERATIAVLGYHRAPGVDEKATEKALAQVRAALESDERFLVIDKRVLETRLRQRSDEILKSSFLRTALRQLDEGRIFYENADPGQAVEALSKADSGLKNGMMFVHDGEMIYLLHLFTGLSFYGIAPTQAQWYFEIAARTDPEARLDRSRYSPSVVEAYDKAREKVLYWAPAKVKVEATGPKADVFIDGIFQGRTPLEINNVVPGVHWLLVERPGGSRWFQEVDLESDVPHSFAADLRRVGLTRGDGTAPEAQGNHDVTNLYTSLADAAGVDFVLFAAADPAGGGVFFQIVSEASRHMGPSVRVPLPVDDELDASGLLATLTDGIDTDLGIIAVTKHTPSVAVFLGKNQTLNDLVLGQRAFSAILAATTEEATEEADTQKPPVTKRPAFWLALLGGMALAGTGVALGVTQPWADARYGTITIPLP